MHKLNSETLLQRAMRVYDNPQCFTLKEFEQDFNRGMRVKTLLQRYDSRPAPALIINHLVILFNVFGNTALDIVLDVVVDKELYPSLFAFLKFLDRLPEVLPEYGIITSEFEINAFILKDLESL